MAKKKTISRSPKVRSKGEGTGAPKQMNHSGSHLRARSGLAARKTDKTATHEPGAHGAMKRSAVPRPKETDRRASARVAPEGRPEREAVPVLQYDDFLDLLTELADSKLSKTDPEIWFMGLYYGPPSNPNDVFMLWVTQHSSEGRFNADPILDSIKTPSQTVTLNDNRSFLQHVVDVATFSGVLKQGSAGNHPDADVINSLIEAIRAERYHIMLPKNPANPRLRSRMPCCR